MSISSEITRIINDKTTIKNKLINLGLADSTANLDDCATAVDSIVNRGTVTASVKEGESVTIARGWHSGSGVITGVSGGGNYSLQEKSVTPTKSTQNVTSDSGYYGLSAVTVGAIPEAYQDVSVVNATASDVLSPKVFVTSDGTATTGSMANNGAVSKTLSTTSTSYTVPSGYHNGSGKVTITTQTKTATPSGSQQVISPDTGKVLSSVTVNSIPLNYGDVTGVTVTASSMLSGVTALGIGAKGYAHTITGSMPNNGAVTGTFTGLGSVTGDTSYTIPAGYHNGSGTVSLTSDIEDMLSEI